jgi:hypothetical protein
MTFPKLFILSLCLIALALLIRPAESATEDSKDTTIWPNRISHANSDPWLVKYHDRIRRMRPRLLVLNFADGVSAEQARTKVEGLIAALRESSRYHGYNDPKAPPFLDYQIGKLADLTDSIPPAEKLDGNSTKYPRVPNWKEGINFQYHRLFEPEFTKLYDIPDPKDPGRLLSLKELVDQGIIHEVWFLAYQGQFGSPYESVEVKQAYDKVFRKLPGQWKQAGNGGDEGQPFIGRSLKILFINVERGPGCAMESLGHSLEGMARCDAIPYLKPYFEEYGGFDLDKKYGTPFDSLYGRNGSVLNYPDPTTLEYTWNGEKRTVHPYIPVGGNVHFVPNGRQDYDMENTQPVLSTIEHYRMRDGKDGKDQSELWTPKVFDRYRQLANDCMGPWLVYWRQNIPGLHNRSKDDHGKPMKNWWPFLFY